MSDARADGSMLAWIRDSLLNGLTEAGLGRDAARFRHSLVNEFARTASNAVVP